MPGAPLIARATDPAAASVIAPDGLHHVVRVRQAATVACTLRYALAKVLRVVALPAHFTDEVANHGP